MSLLRTIPQSHERKTVDVALSRPRERKGARSIFRMEQAFHRGRLTIEHEKQGVEYVSFRFLKAKTLYVE